MNLVVPSRSVQQPPLFRLEGHELTVAIAGLALGGAERIVLDWAFRVYPTWRVHLIVLRDHKKEWRIPESIRITRLHGKNVLGNLKKIGRVLAKSANPVCVCHLLRKSERDALGKAGAFIVPVLHNALAGWLEGGAELKECPFALGVSEACVSDLHATGWQGHASVIHHIVAPRKFPEGTRERLRAEWNIPEDASVIGMIGAFKPQKDYRLAIRLLGKLLEKRDVYLVIIGGPIGKDGYATWKETVDLVHETPRLRARVSLPGFIPDAGACLSAFDMVLNTSHYEGLSIATLEALVNRLPVVARKAGGQGEVTSDGLTIVPYDATDETWIDAATKALDIKLETPRWAHFPSYRLWTLAGLARPVKPTRKGKTLFVTANLNAGGAQRSLVNLATSFVGKFSFEVAVAGPSTAEHFFRDLNDCGVSVFRGAASKDAFDQAESLVAKICRDRIDTVCFWNLDSKIKFLLVKALHFTDVRFVDVSPGCNSFDEARGNAEFQNLISFSEQNYYRRLNDLVLKFNGPYPDAYAGKVTVIPNGVPLPTPAKTNYAINGKPRIVVNGRIAPTKFILEIVAAMRILWEKMPEAELHVFGSAEPRHRDYAEKVSAAAGKDSGNRIIFHGQDFTVASRLAAYDAFVVLAREQGCPNALLEALAAGLPAVANNDGGTKEQIIDRETGLLVESLSPEELAGALLEILTDRNLAEQFGRAGRHHVEETFSMAQMSDRYAELLFKARPKPAWVGKWILEQFVNAITRRTPRTVTQA